LSGFDGNRIWQAAQGEVAGRIADDKRAAGSAGKKGRIAGVFGGNSIGALRRRRKRRRLSGRQRSEHTAIHTIR
jgi:hypothetical protein